MIVPNRHLIVAALTVVMGCAGGSSEPKLVGMPVGELERSLGVHIASWHDTGVAGYEVGCDVDHVVSVLGRQGTVCVVRRGDRVAAIDFRASDMPGGGYDAFRQDIIAAYGLTGLSDRDIYVVRGAGVVHLRPGDGEARLVVTDSAYGEHYVSQILREGFVDLSNGLRPH